jgi:hypothetical protein
MLMMPSPPSSLCKQAETTRVGAGVIKKGSPRAPAKAHDRQSSKAELKAPAKLVVTPSKTQLLRGFHKIQAPMITSELIPFFASPAEVLLDLSHHKSKDESICYGDN